MKHLNGGKAPVKRNAYEPQGQLIPVFRELAAATEENKVDECVKYGWG